MDNITPDTVTDQQTPSPWVGLKLRVLSSAALAAAVLLTLWLGGWWFALLVISAALLMIREWDMLTATLDTKWKLAGLAYVTLPCASLIWLRGVRFDDYEHAGLQLVLFVLLVVWATDIGAFFAGRIIGGAKLAPNISPSKTWAGLGGGMGASAVIGAVSYSFTPYPFTFFGCMGLGLVMAIVAQAGDLLESWLKRRAGVKDSGNLIPGHGGLLDRVDGLIFTIPLFALLVKLSGSVL